MHGENWEFWLNMTNFALGLITFAAVLVVAGAVGWELFERKARRTQPVETRDAEAKAILKSASDAQFVPGLGLTMADGGERIQPSGPQTPKNRPEQG